MLHVVLIEPEIPPNTGNIGRLCLATGSVLHLVGPLGFSLDEKSLRRAGLDYWKDVELRLWDRFEDLEAEAGKAESSAEFYFLTTKTDYPYWNAKFTDGDYLVFGSETRGIPESLLKRHSENCLTIPQESGRSLNLATSVGIVLFEAVRQQNASF
ncbi:MAG: tRNA (cytidine(34)-2'-O)-methyltransferase [Verrucomicrobiales bacterium]|nr:tRNA (cytidine(34)-2'-O)-methyltransferase [Verrucomicrobiales bacterium]